MLRVLDEDAGSAQEGCDQIVHAYLLSPAMTINLPSVREQGAIVLFDGRADAAHISSALSPSYEVDR
jgi:hypothetical protein